LIRLAALTSGSVRAGELAGRGSNSGVVVDPSRRLVRRSEHRPARRTPSR